MNKDEFLTIPDAPDYEVNEHLIVRNKKTKHQCKPKLSSNRTISSITIFSEGRKICLSPQTLYRRALAALDSSEWAPAPSLNGKYELSPEGVLRNSRTKQCLKIRFRGSPHYSVRVNGKQRRVYVKSLMNEVYAGGFPTRNMTDAIAVLLTCDGKSYSFKSISQGAQFISKRTLYSTGYILSLMAKRQQEIFGHAVKYITSNPKPPAEFLVIPDAPDYEVSADFVVRNRKTKYVLKVNEQGYVCFNYGGHSFRRRPQLCYRLAYAAFDPIEWRPVPSLAGNYELSPTGVLRNAYNKKPLTLQIHCRSNYYTARLNGLAINKSVTNLMHEVYGVPIPKPTQYKILLSKDGTYRVFWSYYACAKFLSILTNHSEGAIKGVLLEQPAELFGWAIDYRTPKIKPTS